MYAQGFLEHSLSRKTIENLMINKLEQKLQEENLVKCNIVKGAKAEAIYIRILRRNTKD